MDIVRRVAGEHPRGSAVRIIDQVVNQGTGAARNTIVEKATGEYLFTMDCDDVLIPECIELLYNKMQEHPVDLWRHPSSGVIWKEKCIPVDASTRIL